MYQVFYIDINEEVTSVIDRLRKATSKKLVFVVPARALILNSIVSLKLVKNKAEDLGIDIIFVTNDKLGADLARRSEFVVKNNLDEINEITSTEQQVEEKMDDSVVHVEVEDENNVPVVYKSEVSRKGEDTTREMNGIYPRASRGVSINGVRKKTSFDMGPTKNPEIELKIVRDQKIQPDEQYVSIHRTNLDNYAESGFKNVADVKEKKSQELHKKRISSKKLRFVFAGFVFACIVLIAGIFSYLFLPKTDIYVYPQSSIKEIDLSVIADTKTESLNIERNIIRAKKVDVSDSMSIEYDATGEDYASGQKAKGSVVIYNNYSEEDQILVATTRFEDEKGRIYRLVKGVTVPGMTEEDGENKPGKVEAEIAADKSGSEYNTASPSKFTIPGFKAGPKYDKFYAESSEKITGGGSWGDKVAIITEGDILKARSDVEEKIGESIESKASESVEDGYLVDIDSLRKEIVSYEVFPDSGAVADSFEYGLTMNAEGLAYNEDDLKVIIGNKIGSEEGVELIDTDIEYGQINSDLDEGYLEISAHATIKFQYKINANKILEGLLGVKDAQLKSVIEKYPEIKRLDVMHWPKIFSTGIPKNKERVNIHIVEE